LGLAQGFNHIYGTNVDATVAFDAGCVVDLCDGAVKGDAVMHRAVIFAPAARDARRLNSQIGRMGHAEETPFRKRWPDYSSNGGEKSKMGGCAEQPPRSEQGFVGCIRLSG
jgi:hypothetical protein